MLTLMIVAKGTLQTMHPPIRPDYADAIEVAETIFRAIGVI